jgi:DNA-binding SARP family transcriptional activator
VFGPIKALGLTGSIALAWSKERGLLAALVLFHGRVVSKNRLVDAVWADWLPASPERSSDPRPPSA